MGTFIKRHKAAALLVIGLAVMLAGSICAQAFNTAFYSTKVSRVYFTTDSGTLSGLLYLPEGASESDPRPTLVTTHGYLNSAEMQDAPAIEMSRRGYVVLALDMYDHGHSTYANDPSAEKASGFFAFWPTALWDAVQYMYDQPYVLKDSDGTGVIAVSGHSMGGNSSEMALYYDELNVQKTGGPKKIMAGLSVGADYSWATYLGADAKTAESLFAGRTVGKIAAHYDEFFFNADDAPEGTVRYKDYVSTTEGQTILGLVTYDADGNAVLDPSAKADTWYTGSDGGKRIIYEPYEIHPWNHFSTVSTAHMVDFYDEAFADYQGSLKSIGASNQIWIYKELSELVAMAGFLTAVFSLVVVLLDAPGLKLAITGEVAVLPSASTLAQKIGGVALFVATMVIPSIIYTASGEAANWLFQVGVLMAGLGVFSLAYTLARSDASQKRMWVAGSAIVAVAGALLAYMAKVGVPNDAVFQGPTVSTIVTWALECAALASAIMVCVYLFGNRADKGVGLAHYGFAGGPAAVAASFAVALIAVVASYALLFAVDALFVTDFRIWTFAFKTFEPSAIPAAIKYMPLFFVYYLVAGAGCVNNSSTQKLQGARGYLLAMLTNMGGILLWLIVQYGMDFATGTAWYPDQALSGILLMALVPTLAIASWFTRFLYKKTGNIWTAAFFNTMFFTMMTVANTAIYFQV